MAPVTAGRGGNGPTPVGQYLPHGRDQFDPGAA